MRVLDASQRVVSLIWRTISTQLLFYFCTLMSLVTIHHHSLISQTTAVIACWNINLQRAHKNCSLPTRLWEQPSRRCFALGSMGLDTIPKCKDRAFKNPTGGAV